MEVADSVQWTCTTRLREIERGREKESKRESRGERERVREKAEGKGGKRERETLTCVQYVY